MRSFVFFWRLVEEKGFDLLYPFFDSVRNSHENRVAVFWDGELREWFLSRFSWTAGFCDFRKVADDACRTRFESLPAGTVAYFGRRPFSVIAGILEKADVSLMPSTFLETFGLSALESLSLGVPVAGFPKGGIVPFLVDDVLRLSEGKDFLRSLEILAHAPESKFSDWKASSSLVAERYSERAFLDRLAPILPRGTKRILLVTDFTGSIGGIETYVKNLSDTLERAGYEVLTVGESGGFSSRFEKAVSTVLAFANHSAKNSLSRSVREFRPDVVWCHSVLRRIWPVGLDGLFERECFRMMTYHDLGYFAPFATACRSESDVPPAGFLPFLRKARGILRKAFAVLKYFKLRGLFARLARFDVHLVPSPFMETHLKVRLPSSKIETLPHYVVPACKP